MILGDWEPHENLDGTFIPESMCGSPCLEGARSQLALKDLLHFEGVGRNKI